MVKKSAHPNIELFDYLNGAAEAKTAKAIEEHLSLCQECTSLATLIRKLKKKAGSEAPGESSSLDSQPDPHFSDHPDTNELASFFYATSRPADRSRVASHVALCSSCTEAIAIYAGAEQIAAEYKPDKALPLEIPVKAWEMIRDWENTCFAQLKPASDVLSQDLLSRLAGILNEQSQGWEESGQTVSRSHHVHRPEDAERVPALVVSGSGEVRSVEFFDRVADPTGATVLRHSEGSLRFDNRLVHALLDFGEKEPLVISELVRSDTLRLEPTSREEEKVRRVDCLIVEDTKD